MIEQLKRENERKGEHKKSLGERNKGKRVKGEGNKILIEGLREEVSQDYEKRRNERTKGNELNNRK